MAKDLPSTPTITDVERQAGDLLEAARAGEAEAIERVMAHHPAPEPFTDFSLADAQLTLAREYGFERWQALRREIGERMVEQQDLHRWFGVQLNNGVWDHLDAADIGPESPPEARERLLYSAYASAFHWRAVGGPAHMARGEHLISRAAAAIGLGDVARRHARRCLELVEGHPDETEDWDLAFALEALARAEAAAGHMEAAAATRDRAAAAVAAVADEQDRSIVAAELARGPWFGLP